MELRPVRQDVCLGNPEVVFPSARISRGELGRLGPVEKWLVEKKVCDADEDGITLAVAAGQAVPAPDLPVTSFSLCCDTLPYSANVQAGFILEALRMETVTQVAEHTDSARMIAEAVEGQAAVAIVGGTALIIAAAAGGGSCDTARTNSLGAGALAVLMGAEPRAWKLLALGTKIKAETGMQARQSGNGLEVSQGLGKYEDDSYSALMVEGLKAVQDWSRAAGGRQVRLACSGLDARLNARCVVAAGFTQEALLPAAWCSEAGDLGALNPWLTLGLAAEGLAAGTAVAVLTYAPGSAVDVQLLERTAEPARVPVLRSGGRVLDAVRYRLMMEG